MAEEGSSSPFLQLTRKPRSTNAAVPAEAELRRQEVEEANSSDGDIQIVKVVETNKRPVHLDEEDDDEIVEIDISTGERKAIVPRPFIRLPSTSKRRRGGGQSGAAASGSSSDITFLGTTSTFASASTSNAGVASSSVTLIREASNAVANMISALAPQSLGILRSGHPDADMPDISAIPSSRLFRTATSPRPRTRISPSKPAPIKSPRKTAIQKALEREKSLLPPDDDKPPAQFKCSICLEVATESTVVFTTNCGHLFCESCLNEIWAMAGAKKCPNCRKPISKKGSHRLFLSA